MLYGNQFDNKFHIKIYMCIYIYIYIYIYRKEGEMKYGSRGLRARGVGAEGRK